MASMKPQPEGRILQVHESTILQLQFALRRGWMDEAREIVDRMAAIDEREQLREIRGEAYRRMKIELANGNREAAKRHRDNMRKAADALKDFAI